jgi:hypothetical protein
MLLWTTVGVGNRILVQMEKDLKNWVSGLMVERQSHTLKCKGSTPF